MNIFKISTLAFGLALTGWVACGSSGNSNPDVQNIGAGGAVGTGGVAGATGSGGAGGIGGGVPDAGTEDGPVASPSDSSADVAGLLTDAVTADAPLITVGDAGPVIDICAGLSADQCQLAIINAPADPTVSALDPGPNPPVPYPTCSAQ
jgi:hypothetical protein